MRRWESWGLVGAEIVRDRNCSRAAERGQRNGATECGRERYGCV